ncbi:MAG: hypothetical protein NTY37_10645 [Methanothrix sp.]|nr:hypothetical protein [Methanothrix sp.]
MRVGLVLGILMLGFLLVACNPVTGTETRDFGIEAFCVSYHGAVPHVDVYVDGKYIGNTGGQIRDTPSGPIEFGAPVKITTTEGYHNVKLIKNGCVVVHNNVLFSYWMVQMDFCKCV